MESGGRNRAGGGVDECLDEQQSLIALTLIEKVGPKTCRSLLQHFGGAKNVFNASKGSLAKIPYVGDKVARAIASKETMLAAERELAFAAKNKINVVTWGSDNYPQKLRQIDDSPLVFYAAGELPTIDQPHIGVVGTRTPSAYGKKIANDFASHFAKLGIVVVSGLAFGVDMAAHEATVTSGGRTLAVLGHGLDQIYPREHTPKARQIVSAGGALLTEFPSGTQPEAFNFPARNRIISGLCDAIVVIEATEKGGALITARMAFEQNREVFAVPGNIGAATSVGCNRLIRDQIARIACGPEDVLDGLEHLLRYQSDHGQLKKPKVAAQLSERERIVYDLLAAESLDFDTISSLAQIGPTELRSILLGMEFRGIVTPVAGNKFETMAA
jgi:DNA processing protein